MLRRLEQIVFGKPLAPLKQTLLFSSSKPFCFLEEAAVRESSGGKGSTFQVHYFLLATGRAGSYVGVLIPPPPKFCSHHEYEKRKQFPRVDAS